MEDLAKVPASQAAPDLKRLGTAAWARQRCARAAADSALTVDGRAATLTAVGAAARLRPGQAGLHTLRVECALTVPLPHDATVTVGFHRADASSSSAPPRSARRGSGCCSRLPTAPGSR